MIPGDDGRSWIKICGVTSAHVARVAVNAGAKAVGAVFAERSPRFIETIERADQTLADIDDHALIVGVFLREPGWDVYLRSWLRRRTWCQLHGDISENDILDAPDHARFIRAVPFDPDEIRRWDRCSRVEALLIDAAVPGSGRTFDHEALAEMMPEISKPVILAGGLTPDNVAEAIRVVRPAGVDVSSGVESRRGVKDEGLIRAFCDAVRSEPQA